MLRHLSLRKALIAAGLVVAGSTGTVLIAAGAPLPGTTLPPSVPTDQVVLEGSCIGPVDVLDAVQTALSWWSPGDLVPAGIWVQLPDGLFEWAPAQVAESGPQNYTQTEGCAPDGGQGTPATTLPPPTTSVTTLPPTTVAPTTTAPPTTLPPSTTTTVAPTTTTVMPTTTTVPQTTTTTAVHRHLVCHVERVGHHWRLRCHWVWS